jgi:hypothetical protein
VRKDPVRPHGLDLLGERLRLAGGGRGPQRRADAHPALRPAFVSTVLSLT